MRQLKISLTDELFRQLAMVSTAAGHSLTSETSVGRFALGRHALPAHRRPQPAQEDRGRSGATSHSLGVGYRLGP